MIWNPFKKITYQSDINGTITIGKQKNEKALYAGGVTQSGGEIAPMWDEVIGNVYRDSHAKPQNDILILGVGGGSVIHAIRKYDKKAMITGIELDPVMMQVAREQFGIEENAKQKIIIVDAKQWIQKQSRTSRLVYGTIIVDLYIGPLNPPKARTKAFLEQLKTLAKPNGIIIYNAHYQKKNKGEYERFRKITDAVFENVEEVFAYPLNRVLCMQRY